MTDSDALYQAIGRKIRGVRERTSGKLSQDKLAKRLGISRASVVNIEAGRQHAPLHLLWEIAETLGTNLALLLPQHDELISTTLPIQLDEKMMRQIERAANGNSDTHKRVTGLVNKLKNSIETAAMIEKTPND